MSDDESIVIHLPAKNPIADVVSERIRQDDKWGGGRDHLDAPAFRGDQACRALRIPLAHEAQEAVEEAAMAGCLSWAAILQEEVSEAVEAGGEGDQVALRKELVQVAAVAVAWIEAIDRR